MAVFELNDLCYALRSFDEKLREHVMSLDEKPGLEGTATLSQQPDSPAAAAQKSPAGVTDDKREKKTDVTVSIVFAKINGIDTIKDRFAADIQIQVKWREPLLDNTNLNSAEIEWGKYWSPKLNVANGIGELKNKINFSIKYDGKGRATIIESRQTGGTFFEFMELNKFPFDSQDLTVTLVSERTTDEVALSEDDVDKCAMKPTSFNSIQEWKMLPILNVWTKAVKKKSDGGVKTVHPGFSCALKTSRRPQYYMYNIVMLLAMMGSFSMATFTVNVLQPQFRIQLTFFLMLTTITFKFTVNKSLPKIPYLTYMDKYIIGIMVMIFSVCVWHAVVGGLIHQFYVDKSTPTTTTTTKIPTTTTTTLATPVDNYADYVGSTISWPVAKINSTSATAVKVNSAYDPYAHRRSDLSYAASAETQLADKIALMIVAGVFITIHSAFFIAGGLSYRDLAEGPNSEEDEGKDDDDD